MLILPIILALMSSTCPIKFILPDKSSLIQRDKKFKFSGTQCVSRICHSLTSDSLLFWKLLITIGKSSFGLIHQSKLLEILTWVSPTPGLNMSSNGPLKLSLPQIKWTSKKISDLSELRKIHSPEKNYGRVSNNWL